MNKLITLALTLSAALILSACPAAPGNNTANTTNKPANTANNAANSGNANKANTNSTSNTNASKTAIKDEKASKPTDDKTKKAKNAPTIPAEWIYYADDQRGYGFSLPIDSVEGESGTTDGVDYFSAETPQKISVIVYAFKDSSLSKDDLLERAEKMLNAMGETVKSGELKGESDDYKVADATSEGGSGEKSNLKILVATDVTDNYVMFVSSAAADYEKNKATMDMIWGSFEMYSGGASNN